MNIGKKLLSILLCLMLVFSTLAVGDKGLTKVFGSLLVKASAEGSYSVGDIIEFGSYPQSDVTSSLGSVLNSQIGTWQSYNYYSGTGELTDGCMTSSNFMRYKDVTYNGTKYRGVIFDSYRPSETGNISSTSTNNTFQYENKYKCGNIYWFRYEPLQWRVLDPSTGFVMCKTIIDSQAYSNYIILNSDKDLYYNDSEKYASDWKTSSLRAWLNNDFYYTAFSDEQKANILTSTISNKCWSSICFGYDFSVYDSKDTQDKVFLLAYDEVINSSYGFNPVSTNNDMGPRLQGTDYAKCQGLWVYNSSLTKTGSEYDGNSYWWLRSPHDNSINACGVSIDGFANGPLSVYYTSIGVCPALKLQNLKSDYVGGEIENASITAETTYTTEGGHVSKSQVTYDKNWFSSSNQYYNHSLARFCADFAMMGYLNNKTELSQNLAKFGFGNAEIDLETGQKENPGRDEVNYFIADKKENINGEEYTVVFAGFIGSNGYQWYSNFDPNGTQRKHSYAGNFEKGKVHLGFADARDFAIGKLQAHINNLNVDKSKLKLIITGHSRGAATANLVSAKILDGTGLCYGSNLYTYTFATPNVVNQRADGVNIYADKYKCIFNIVNPEDFVTKVLLSDWGFGRYGVTYTLPSKTNDNNYEKYYLSKMRPEFNKYTGQTYVPYTRGEKSTYSIVKTMSSEVKTLSQLYDNKYPVGLTHVSSPFQFFKYALIPLVSGKEASGDDYVGAVELLGRVVATPGAQLYREIAGFFIDITRFSDIKNVLVQFLKDHNTKNLFDNVPNLLNFTRAHQMETYCAYMNTMSSASLTYYREAYKNTVNCPVDIEVYDNFTGELVGKITNNIIDENVAAKEGSIVMDVDGDSKEFWLPSNGNYRVVLTGNDNGTMDYTVADIDSDTGEKERVNFFDVGVVNGKTYEGDFSRTYDSIGQYILIDSNGNMLNSSEVIADESKQYNISITVEGFGGATGPMTVTSGDYVSLKAEVQEGADFVGWFENGALVSDELELSFVAKSDRTLTAKFKSRTYKVTWIVEGTETTQSVDFGSVITKPTNPIKEGYTFKGWTPEVPATMPASNLTFTAIFEKNNPTASAKLNAKTSTTVDYRSKVNITATASGVPDGYFLAIYSGNTLLEKGTKDKVSYTPKDNNKPAELKSDTTYTVKVIDGKNAVQKDSNGKDLTANVEIKVKQGFFDKLIAFFKGLFGLLPTVEIKP